MKKIILLLLVTILTNVISAQNKFGYLDSQEILLLMPEYKSAEKDLQEFVKSLDGKQLLSMQTELQNMFSDYQQNIESYTDLVKADKEAEIQSLQARVQSFEQNAQISIQQKQADLLQPIQDKLRNAIDNVAKENNYTYIFEKPILLYVEESENILPLVKKKLKL